MQIVCQLTKIGEQPGLQQGLAHFPAQLSFDPKLAQQEHDWRHQGVRLKPRPAQGSSD